MQSAHRSSAAPEARFYKVRSVAANDSGVFVADDGDGTSNVPPQIRHVDPGSDQYHELRLAAHDLYLQIDNGYAVARIDPATNSVKETLTLGKSGGYGYGELEVTTDKVWTVDQYSQALYALAPSPLAKTAEYPIDKRFDGDLTASASLVFVEDTTLHEIGAFDATAGFLSHTIQAGSDVNQLTIHAGTLVIALSYTGDGAVLFVDPTSGNQKSKIAAVYADELAFQ